MIVDINRNLEGRRIGIAANLSVLTYLPFLIKNLKNSHCTICTKIAKRFAKSFSQSEARFTVAYSEPITSSYVNIKFS